jgi:hypothetical protein
MGEKLTHKEHKYILTFVVLFSIVLGLFIGRYISGLNEKNDLLIILLFGMVFMIAVLLFIILAILTKIEEDVYWHIKKGL